jgi:hypothetical protein
VPNPWRTGSKVWHLQRNVRASPQEALHEITWTDRDDPEKKEETTEALHTTGTGWGYGFVRELTPGDRIAIYARAQVSISCSDLAASLTCQYASSILAGRIMSVLSRSGCTILCDGVQRTAFLSFYRRFVRCFESLEKLRINEPSRSPNSISNGEIVSFGLDHFPSRMAYNTSLPISCSHSRCI